MSEQSGNILRESIVWDRLNWGFLIKFLEHNININKISSALELGVGDSGGGLSLYLASKGIRVVCSDIKDISSTISSAILILD